MARVYDVIIIGSGAGGGTLARHLAPSGKRILHPGARRLAAARAGELGRRGGVHEEPLRPKGDLVRQATARPFSRACTTGSAARPSCTARRSTACARRTSASCATTTASRRPGPSRYDEMEPYYTQAEQIYQVHGARGEDPTEPPSSAPYPFPAVSHEPRIQQLHDDLAAGRLSPLPLPLRHDAERGSSRSSAPASAAPDCDGFPCLVHAKSDAEVLGVRPALQHPNVTLLTDALVVKLHDQRRGHGRDRGGGRARAASRRPTRAASSSSPAAPPTRPSCCCVGQRQAPQRPGQRLGPGRPQLHVPQQRGRAGDLQGAEPDQVPEDPGPERLLLRHARLRLPDGQHPDGRQVAGADVQGREADRGRAGADVHPGRGRHARRRLLALDRGPARCRTTG